MRILIALVLLLCTPAFLSADESGVDKGSVHGTVSVTSATAGTLIPQVGGEKGIRRGTRVGVPTTAAVSVCFAFIDVDLSCATALTTPAEAEPCLAAGTGYEWLHTQHKWNGQVCAILKSGVTAVAVGYNSW